MALNASKKCVYCFRTLKPEDVCFENVINTVDPTFDQEKYNYRMRVNPNTDKDDREVKTRKPIKQFSKAEQGEFIMDEESDGYPMHWRQPVDGGAYYLTNDRRICRYCHMPLPVRFGRCPNIMIGFCGNTGAGKSVYMLSLLHDLTRVDGMSVTWDAAVNPDRDMTPETVNYKEDYDAMYNGRDGLFQLPDATLPKKVLPPMVLNCMYNRTEFVLTAYDMAGEGMRDESYMARMTEFLMHADGVVYLKDPDYLPGIDDEDKPQKDKLSEHEYLETVFNRIAAGTAQRGGKSAHIAITMTKIDKLLRRYRDNPEFMKIVGSMFDNPGATMYKAGFDGAATANTNSKMKKLYEWANTRDEAILNIYNRQLSGESRRRREKVGFFGRLFGRRAPDPSDEYRQCVMLFGASPLGLDAHPRRKSEMSTIEVMDTEPNGIFNADPVLWILYCNDVFPAQKYTINSRK